MLLSIIYVGVWYCLGGIQAAQTVLVAYQTSTIINICRHNIQVLERYCFSQLTETIAHTQAVKNKRSLTLSGRYAPEHDGRCVAARSSSLCARARCVAAAAEVWYCKK